MIHLALALIVLSGSPVDDLVPQQIKTIKLQVPAIWKHTQDQGTEVFSSPAHDAQLLVDLGTTQSRMEANACVNKIVSAMGQTGWSRVSIGTQPAARKVDEDADSDRKTVVDTITYVGCNGRTSWSIQFRVNANKRDRYVPLLAKIVESLTYL